MHRSGRKTLRQAGRRESSFSIWAPLPLLLLCFPQLRPLASLTAGEGHPRELGKPAGDVATGLMFTQAQGLKGLAVPA